jgi:serine phosphatase RsbU (regulator of sigma subunit)/PAS domain-containing protein
MTTAAQQVAREGIDIWWPAGPPDDRPLIGRWPRGARVALPLHDAEGILGSMVICWPEPLDDFPAPLRHQLTALAELSAQALGTRLPHTSFPETDPPQTGISHAGISHAGISHAGISHAGISHPSLAADYRASWAFGILDGLLDSALFAHAVRDDAGAVADFRIDHVSAGFLDPAGRRTTDLVGLQLLEAYPGAALDGGLFDRCVKALATGEPQHLIGEMVLAPVGTANGDPSAEADGDTSFTPVVEVRIAQLYDGVAITWRGADEADRLAALLQHAQRLGRIGGWEENLVTSEVHWTEPTFALLGQRSGAPVPLADLHALVPADDVPELTRFRDALLCEKRESAAAFRIVRPDDGSMRQLRAYAEPVTDPSGTVVAVRGAYQDMSADYHTHVAFAATREQLADTEQRAEEEHRLALRLQQAITPRSGQPVEAAGLEVAARYRPSGPGNLVSGDWYDTVLLPTKQVLLVVGDIGGHGIDAVTGMVALRNSLRGLAITGAGPGTLLGWLNAAACHLTDGIIGTAICGIYDPADRSLRWARAGHLPPILVRDGVARELSLPQGLLLGVDPETSYDEVTTALQLGDRLLLFTDGLIERRDEPIDVTMDSLLRIVGQPISGIGNLADYLVASATSNTDDDACLVAVHVR